MEDKLLTEADLLKVLGLKKSALGQLRRNGLPYVRISKLCRCYFLSDLMEWSKGKRIVLDSSVYDKPTKNDDTTTINNDDDTDI